MARKNLPIGDRRLNVPFTRLLKAMVDKISVTLRRLSGSRSEEVSFGRFINHPAVTPSHIIKQHWHNLNPEWSGRHLLLIEDATTLSFKLNAMRKDLGYVGKSQTLGGFQLHNSLILDADDLACYGVGSAQVNKTEFSDKEQRKERRRDRWKTPLEEKETYRWYTTIQSSVRNCPGAACYTVIADQEADIYEIYGRLLEQNWNFVIRGTDNRLVMNDKGEKLLLSKTLSQCPVLHTYEAAVCSTPVRSAHVAKLQVKYTAVQLPKPKDHPNQELACRLSLWVIEITEDAQSVSEGEEPIHWVLFTSHPVPDVQAALMIIAWYCARWNIEQLYRSVKLEGLDIEHSEVQSLQALANLATLALIAATQIMTLLRARDAQTQQSADLLFTQQETECLQKVNPTLEGKTEKQKNPHPPNSMAFATWVIARLGGWTPYNKKRPPGPITIANGMVQFYAIYKGYVLRL
jgi:Transposase DDE domain